MAQAEYQTLVGQIYIIIMLLPFAVKVLWAKVTKIDVLVKELKRMLKSKALVAHDMDTILKIWTARERIDSKW